MPPDIILTREGHARLAAELEDLKGPTRARIADAIREAKSHGDLRENAAYHEAKLNQSRLEGRIADLEKVLQLAKVVDAPVHSGEIAHLNSKVKLKDLTWDDELTITLVGSFEADPSKDMISITSPLGSAIMGKSVGDQLEVEAPAGVQKYEILAIG